LNDTLNKYASGPPFVAGQRHSYRSASSTIILFILSLLIFHVKITRPQLSVFQQTIFRIIPDLTTEGVARQIGFKPFRPAAL
jgi:hypothetical protein